MGCAAAYRQLLGKLTKGTGCKSFAIDYRLAPQNPFPCAVIDAVSGYLYLLRKYKPENIIFGGDSAGGGLALSSLLTIREMGLPMPAGSYCLSPWVIKNLCQVDLTHSFPSFYEHSETDFLPDPATIRDKRLNGRAHYYTTNENLSNQFVSPYFAEKLSGLPPCLIQCGGAERLRDESIGMAKRLESESSSSVTVEVFEVRYY
jgi:acetyl esterase/lipase